MAVLDPGRLLKFLLTGEYGWVLLQVIDILPVDLDHKKLWPKQGFRIMLSDGRHSSYVSLTDEQEELVLNNKLQVGQFIYVNRIVPGAFVPYIQGLHPTPGCHPLVGTPQDLSNLMAEPNLVSNLMTEPNLAEGKSNNLKRSCNVSLQGRNEKNPASPRLCDRRRFFPGANLKVGSFTCTLRKPSISSPDVAMNSSPVADGNALPKSLPGKLGTLGKDALHWRNAAFVAASIAHQEASAMEALVKILKKFARLCSEANPKAPDTAVEQFLDIHPQISQALTAMEEPIKAATSDKIQAFEDNEKMSNSFEDKEKMPDMSNTDRSFLHEIGCNSTTQESPLKLSKTLLRKFSQDLSGSSDQNNEKKDGFYQMANLAKQMKNEIESWFIEFIEKTLDACFKNTNSSEDSRTRIVDSTRIPESVSSKKVLLTTLIDWVESQSSGSNREGLSSYPKVHEVLSRLKLAKNC